MENLKVENYLKAIYQICAQSGEETASTGEIARRLELTPGSVTAMLQRLAESKMVRYKPHHGVRLTAAGRKMALRVLRRHRLVELFLAKTLGLPWDEIHEEAENLEHAVSDRLVDRIDAYLNYPESDPHGDPIPDNNGKLRRVAGEPLSECQSETRFSLERVLDQTPEFLRYLSDGQLEVGTSATVVENHPSAGIITVQSGERRISLSREMAQKLIVQRIE